MDFYNWRHIMENGNILECLKVPLWVDVDITESHIEATGIFPNNDRFDIRRIKIRRELYDSTDHPKRWRFHFTPHFN